ncbi:hypothetical protein GCM10012285_61480 [Streptomyces kronopolitis]|uniref:Uncharacterized protein n=1 Tax=Streptomyces kronopolitis TaxID=1612435 RepID=A0ABQ2K3H0_9ACTN|nr:hypothetical protein [Streptomyces kronopolitis]GGN61930.1 hypothetical protein GCM10012285_61480 [Streptomyces kronopolitis]
MKITCRPAAVFATEVFDAETLALLDAVAVELPDFGPVDLDIAFGTPLEMYGLVTTDELARWDAAAAVTTGKTKARTEVVAAFGARRDAARDIAVADPSIGARVRERLVDVLLPYAAQLRIAPATEPLPLAA